MNDYKFFANGIAAEQRAGAHAEAKLESAHKSGVDARIDLWTRITAERTAALAHYWRGFMACKAPLE